MAKKKNGLFDALVEFLFDGHAKKGGKEEEKQKTPTVEERVEKAVSREKEVEKKPVELEKKEAFIGRKPLKRKGKTKAREKKFGKSRATKRGKRTRIEPVTKRAIEKQHRRIIRKVNLLVKELGNSNRKMRLLEKISRQREFFPHERHTKEELSRQAVALHNQLAELELQIRKQDLLVPEYITQQIQTIREVKPAGEMSTEEEIMVIKELLNQTRVDFFKRKISEDEYKKINSNYLSKLRELEAKYKVVGEREKEEELQQKKFAADEGVTKRIVEKEVEKPTQAKSVVSAEKRREVVVRGEEKPTLSGTLEKELELAFTHTDDELDKLMARYQHSMKSAKLDLKKGDISKQEYGKIQQAFSSKMRVVRDRKLLLEKEAGMRKPLEQIQSKKGTVSVDQFKRIEEHVGGLLKRYNISMDEIERDVDKLDKEKILMDFHKLINVIDVFRETRDLERQIDRSETYRAPAAQYEQGAIIRERQPLIEEPVVVKRKHEEKLKSLAKDIKKYKIATTFDSLLELVRSKDHITQEEAEKNIGMKINNFEEYAEILEKNGLVKIEYPAIGGMRIAKIEKKPGGKKEKEENGNNNSETGRLRP